jgi:molybdenum cofactor guanylyltransferase
MAHAAGDERGGGLSGARSAAGEAPRGESNAAAAETTRGEPDAAATETTRGEPGAAAAETARGAATVAVLAGGQSRRMGRAKALVAFRDAPLISYPLAAAREAGLAAAVVAKPGSELPPLDVAVWHEDEALTHPLAGLVAALAHGPAVAVACDQPFVPAALLAALAARSEPLVVGTVDGAIEPFPGRYEPSLLPALRDALARQASLRATIAALGAATIDLTSFGDPARIVASMNTPDAIAAAEALP